MERDQLFREHARAMALGDGETANRLRRQIPEEDLEGYVIYVSAFFAASIDHRLGDSPTSDQIKHFVRELQEDFRKADPAVNPLVVEGCIRTLYGEDDLLDSVSIEDQLRAQWFSIRKIVDQSPEMTSRLDVYLDDTQKLARYWESAD